MGDDLVSAIGKLPPPYAQALRLRVAGATPDDVGVVLGLDEAAVQPLLVIAEEKLRELLVGIPGEARTGTGETWTAIR